MTQTASGRAALGLMIALSLLTLPLSVNAQEVDVPETSLAPDAVAGDELPRLPGALGQCDGARLRVLSAEAPFGEPLGSEMTSGRVEFEYLLPEGTMNAFISFSVPEASGLSIKGSEILDRNAAAPNINPDASYSSDTMTATVLDLDLGAVSTTEVDLVGASEAVYIEKWGFSGVEISDFLDPPYTYGDRLDVFLTFELGGVKNSWSSRNSSPDCLVR